MNTIENAMERVMLPTSFETFGLDAEARRLQANAEATPTATNIDAEFSRITQEHLKKRMATIERAHHRTLEQIYHASEIEETEKV